jgi:tetratricopeptide (TPR) repeat protein
MSRVAGLSFMLMAVVALAANPKATVLAKDAERLYKDGQYKEAAKLLEEAYQLEPNPKFLYNQARAFDQAGELQPSLATYRRYVSLPSQDTEPDLVKKANLSMDRLRQLIARQEADQRLRDAEKSRLEKEAADARARANAEAEKAKRQKADFEARERAQSESQKNSVGTRKIAAFVVGGFGLAAIVTGTVFGLLSNGSKQAFRNAELLEDKRARQAATVTQSWVADISFGVGILSAVAAVVLFPKSDPDGLTVALGPVPGGGILSALTVPLP